MWGGACACVGALITAEAVPDSGPDVLLGTQGADRALVVDLFAADVGCIACLAAEDIAGTSNAAVAHGSSVLLTGGNAADLVVEGDGWPLASLVGVACAADAGEEAACVGCRAWAVDDGRGDWDSVGDRGGGRGPPAAGAGAVGVPCAATTGAHVGGGGGGWLGKDVVGRHFGCL